MATDTCARKGIKPSQAGAPPAESEHLPCPRCDSTNTKFCYYNNYNFSQPRHFCKSCRRYWTHGGTLRDVPVGGGSRKNSKRSRTSVAAATTASTGASTVFSSAHNDFHHMSAGGSPLLFPLVADHGGSLPFVGDAKTSGSFTSLLNNTQGNGLLTLGGYGLDDVGFGVGKGAWPFLGAVEGGPSGGNGWGSTVAGYRWHDENEEGGLVEGGDYFVLPEPDLAISTPASVLK